MTIKEHIHRTNLFDGENATAQFASCVYERLLSRDRINYTDVMADRISKSIDKLPTTVSTVVNMANKERLFVMFIMLLFMKLEKVIYRNREIIGIIIVSDVFYVANQRKVANLTFTTFTVETKLLLSAKS